MTTGPTQTQLQKRLKTMSASVAVGRRWREGLGAYVRTFVRCFVVGSGGKTLVNVLLLLLRRRHRPPRGPLSPASSLKLLRDLLDLRYGLFLASYSVSWKALYALLASQPSPAPPTHPALPSFPSSAPSSLPPLPSSQTSSLREHKPHHRRQHGGQSQEERIASAASSSSSGLASREAAMNAALAGAVSGLSLYWLPKAHRKVFALYTLTRSGEFLARYLASRRLLPESLLSLAPHMDVAIMALSASQILFSYIMERDTLDPVYSSFLIKFGGKDVRVIDAIAPMRRGGRLDRKMFLEWAREQNLPDIMGCIFGLHHNVICDVVHPGTDCVTHFIRFTYEGFWRAFPMYATMHSATTILYLFLKLRSFFNSNALRSSHDIQKQSQLQIADEHRDALILPADDSMRAHSISHGEIIQQAVSDKLIQRSDSNVTETKLNAGACIRSIYIYLRGPGHMRAILQFFFFEVLQKLAFNVIRSSLFLGLYCASGWFGACLAQRLFLMKDVRWFYAWLALPGLASMIEVPARRRELALYCLPKAMESFYTVLNKYGQIPQVLQYFQNGEVFIFTIGSAVTLFCYVTEKTSLRPTFVRIMDWLWA